MRDLPGLAISYLDAHLLRCSSASIAILDNNGRLAKNITAEFVLREQPKFQTLNTHLYDCRAVTPIFQYSKIVL